MGGIFQQDSHTYAIQTPHLQYYKRHTFTIKRYLNSLILCPQEPWLDTKIIEPRSNSRHRRSTFLMCTENSTEPRCCHYPLNVGFADFGWNWVIAPSHVQADYCSGECHMSMQYMTPHSWFNQQLPGSNGACCSPTKFAPLPLLYFDVNGNLIHQILQDMMVERCGCI